MTLNNLTLPIFQDFGAPLTVSAPIQYSAEELEAAKIHAHEQGFIEGKEQGFTQGQTQAISDHQTQIDTVLNAIESKLSEAALQYQDIKTQSAQDTLTLIQIIVSKLLPQWVAEHGLSALTADIQDVVNHIYTQKKITVRINPHMLTPVREKLNYFLGKHEEVVLAPGENIEKHACEITWDGGGAEFGLEALAQKITQTIELYTLPQNLTPTTTKEVNHE